MALLWRVALLSAALAMLPVAAASTPATAPSPPLSLAALKLIEPGLWQLEIRGRAPRQMCIADLTALLQVEHEQAGCSHFVIANEPRRATIHYSCQSAGWGRTTIRVEAANSAVIRTQGISRNAPFDYNVQARRLGACSGQSASGQR